MKKLTPTTQLLGRTFLILLLIGTFFCGKSQKLSWGEEIKLNMASGDVRFIHKNESGSFWLLKRMYPLMPKQPPTFYFLHLKPDFTLQKKERLTLEYKNKKLEFLGAISWNDEIHVFSSIRIKRLKKRIFFRQIIDPETLTPKGLMEELFDHEALGSTECQEPLLSFSPDRSHLVLGIGWAPKSENRKLHNQYLVFEKGKEEAKEIYSETPTEKGWIYLTNLGVDNEGQLTSIVEKGWKEERGTKYYEMEIQSFNYNGGLISKKVIEFGEAGSPPQHLDVSHEDELFITWFYSKDGIKGFAGLHSLVIDKKTGEILRENEVPFSKDFLRKNMNKADKPNDFVKWDVDDGLGLFGYQINEIYRLADGSSLLVGSYHTRRFKMLDAYSLLRITQITNNIIVLKLGKEGEILWDVTLPKRHLITREDGDKVPNFGGSYGSFFDGEILHFIYNDNRKNLNLKSEYAQPEDYHEGIGNNRTVVLASVNGSGECKRFDLSAKGEFRFLPMPRYGVSLDGSNFLFWNVQGRIGRIGTVEVAGQ